MKRCSPYHWLTRTTAALFLASVALAQPPRTTNPNQDSIEVYTSFFFFHDNFAKWTEERVAANPSRRAQLVGSSARFLGIAPDEFSKLESITATVTRQLRAVSEEAHEYVAAAAQESAGIDPAKLISFNERRGVIVDAGVARMRNSLSSNSWHGLHAYINERHRQHVNIPRSNPSLNSN